MSDWATAARAASPGRPMALVTVLATEGAAPRGPGARLLVTTDGQAGTIGGGALEWRAAEQARALLALPPGSWRVQDYPLGPLLGQCCGGCVRLLVEHLGDTDWIAALAGGAVVSATLRDDHVARVAATDRHRWPRAELVSQAEALTSRGPLPTAGFAFVEPDDSARRRLILFGAGHVGRAIARMLPGLPFDLAWFDTRAELADIPGVTVDNDDALVACAAQVGAGAAVLILTHDHAFDYRLAAAALGSAADYVGMIGSTTKRARFLSRLVDDGVDSTRLTCPIGQPGIPGKTPEVIAVATLAQLLALGPVT
ncbi:MAG: xanthine dehydrogenase accessory protein XdhC [Sphingomonas sp.]|jgi:xanthine dehydrogenase accessory factor|uniref:xanthine dehydrogenase accessory protein XdhC n=1 Tax=Sphingomonas sp. TaxID=28214 RepID=UPI0035627F86